VLRGGMEVRSTVASLLTHTSRFMPWAMGYEGVWATGIQVREIEPGLDCPGAGPDPPGARPGPEGVGPGQGPGQHQGGPNAYLQGRATDASDRPLGSAPGSALPGPI
jgi:hypothetical protein